MYPCTNFDFTLMLFDERFFSLHLLADENEHFTSAREKFVALHKSCYCFLYALMFSSPSVTIKMSSKTLHPARVYWHSLLGYNGSSNWTDVSLLGHHARILDSRPCFHYSIRFEQVGLSETTRSCHQTDWMGNELSMEKQLHITGQERSI